jgi:hypothetical protein
MKTYIADLYFDHAPDPLALLRATAAAFDVPSGAVAEGWFLGDQVRAAYDNPAIQILWLRNYDLPGPFPFMYGLAMEDVAPGETNALSDKLALITHALGVAAVMPLVYGKMHLFGPDGSARVVMRDEDSGDDVIRLAAADKVMLDKTYRASRAVAS